MKLVFIVITALIVVLVVIAFKKLIKGIRVEDTLVTYNGRVCNYWELKLWPDEYIHGWVFKTAKLSPRIDVRTGTNQEVTPPQAAALIDYLLETYPVKSNGATLTNSGERKHDKENRQTTIIWRFSKAPARGVTQATMTKMINDLLREFDYMLPDKWPLEPGKFIDENQRKAKEYVHKDMIRRGI